MAFEQFYAGRHLVNVGDKICVQKNGAFAFPVEFYTKHLKGKGFQHVTMFYDLDRKAIAMRFTVNKEEGAYRFVDGGTYAGVNPQAFRKMVNPQKGIYDYTEEDGMFVVEGAMGDGDDNRSADQVAQDVAANHG